MNKKEFKKYIKENRSITLSIHDAYEMYDIILKTESSDFKKNASIIVYHGDQEFISQKIGKSDDWRTKCNGKVINKLKVDNKKVKVNSPVGCIDALLSLGDNDILLSEETLDD